MQPTRSNDARSSNIRKESPTLEDTVDAELWLNLMTSMMNFAVASTNLMKAIQDKTGVSVAYKDERMKPNETMNLTQQPEEVEEICTTKTCEVLHQTEEKEEEPPIEESKDVETEATNTEKPSDIDEPQSETKEELPQAEGLQTEEPDELEIKESEEPTETTNEEQPDGTTAETEATEIKESEEPTETTNEEQPDVTPAETEDTEETSDLKDQQQEIEPDLQKKPVRKTCNIAYQEKEPYTELCPGSCGQLPQSRIPLPIKRKKHKYSLESRKKLEAAREEMGKPPKRLCGCRAEECENNPCSCEDLTICAPSKVAGVCVCAEKTKTPEVLPEEATSLAAEELVVQEEATELMTAPSPDQEIVTTEMSVQATEVLSKMCCCDEKLIDEELLALDGDCACQTDPTESFPDFEVSTISQHLQQTDENLEELRKEVQRISDCITGRKRYADDVAAALYREIMKPRTSVVEVTGASNKMSPKRRDQSWF
ncbi:hypothetical protein WA026_021369 [Henosepilachna vigintioctopunctata]|uniref:Uncharacterized protein n=1 Tax=Henosepilachna vigintioctopunctata TaxID=420089 RepID=A0AAW1U191_9CUCU